VQGLAGYILRRLLLVPLILFVVSIVTFALGRFAPADYVDIQAGPRAKPETIERIKEERGLNDPVYEQYVRYMGNVLQGDLGESVRYRGVSVEDVILPRLWVTLQYNIVVMILTFAIGIPVGTWAALRRGTWLDPLPIGVFVLFASVPVLVSVPFLQWLFAVKLGWLPTGGWKERNILGVDVGIFSAEAILPITALTLVSVAGLARYMRAQVLDVLDQDFVRTARAKGLDEYPVITRHVVRNALLPIATLMGFEIASLFGGSIILETLLGIPGIGLYTFDSIGSRDYDSIMAIVLIGALVFQLAMLATDIAYGFIDPRIRLSAAART
jgi:ABC-type dipeptide/oligopeptide/nickel transport system permease component